MNTIPKAEREKILARAMEIVSLDADAMLENRLANERQLIAEFAISHQRARSAVAKAARIKRHPNNIERMAKR